MKKKMIFAAIAVVALISGVTGANLQKGTTNTNSLALANVEALSRFEFPDSWGGMWNVTRNGVNIHCDNGGDDDCPTN